MNSQLIITACGVFAAILALALTFYTKYEHIPNKKLKLIFIILFFLDLIVFVYALYDSTESSNVDIGSHTIETKIKEENYIAHVDNSVASDISLPPQQNQSPAPMTKGTPPIARPSQPPAINELTPVPNSPQPANTTIDSNPVVVSNSSTSIGFARTNQYVKNGVEPNCEPDSKQTTCSSSDYCVDCNGKCWPPGSYDSGKTKCSQGKWTLTSYTRTNQYVENGVEPNCEPESKQATCSSPDACVDCNGKCWPPGSYDSGKTICSQGKWTISWTEHTYR